MRRRMRRLGQGGFNLIQIAVYAGILLAIVGGSRLWMAQREREATRALILAQQQQIRDKVVGYLKNDDAWRATVSAFENQQEFACLRQRTPCSQRGGPIAVRDSLNRLYFDAHTPANGFNGEGFVCGSYREEGSDACPFRLDVAWQPDCIDDCTDPEKVLLKGHVRFRAGPGPVYLGLKMLDVQFALTRPTRTATPRSCHDHLEAGHSNDGLYPVRPNPAEPAFNVYCDQSRDGGGWALAVSAARSVYHNMPEIQGLTPNMTGRLPAAQIKAYLDASKFLDTNNLRLEMPDTDGGIVVSASTAGSIEAGSYVATMPKGDCRKMSEARNEAHYSAAPALGLFFTGGGEIGLDETSTFPAGYHGFTACMGTTPGGRACGTGCGRKLNGELFQQKGQIWIR